MLFDGVREPLIALPFAVEALALGERPVPREPGDARALGEERPLDIVRLQFESVCPINPHQRLPPERKHP